MDEGRRRRFERREGKKSPRAVYKGVGAAIVAINLGMVTDVAANPSMHVAQK